MSYDTGTLGGMSWMLNKPSTYESGGPWGIIIHYRGVGQTYDLVVNDPLNGVTAALSENFLYGAIDTNPDVSFGNDDGQTHHAAFLQYIIDNYNTTECAGALAQSAGGATGIRHFLSDSRIKSYYGIFPILNLDWAQGAGFSVTVAHGGGSYDAHDPMQIDTAEYTGKAFHFIHSEADTIVPPTPNTHAFRTKIAGVAAEYGLTVSTGEHGDASSFLDDEVLEYFQRTVVADAPSPVLYLFRS